MRVHQKLVDSGIVVSPKLKRHTLFMRPLARFLNGRAVCLACLIWLARIEPSTAVPPVAARGRIAGADPISGRSVETVRERDHNKTARELHPQLNPMLKKARKTHKPAPKAAVHKTAPPPLEEPAARRNNCSDQWPKSGRIACQAFKEGRLISNLSDAGLEYPLSADDLGRAWLQRGNSSRLDSVLRQLRCGVATRIAVLGGSVTCGNTMFGKFLPKGTRWTDVWLELLQRGFGPQVWSPPVVVSHAGVW